MKKIIFAFLVMVLGATSVQAEETNFEYDNGYRWFINAHGNIGMSVNETFYKYKFADWLAPGANIQIGYNFSDYWGLFAAAGWNRNRTFSNGTSYKFTSWEPSLNVMYNLTNGFCGYRPNRRHNLYAYAGFVLGITRNFEDEFIATSLLSGAQIYPDEVCYGGRIGLQYIWSFSKWVGLSMYADFTIFNDKFDAIDAGFPLDGRVNAGIGFHFNISKNTKKVTKTYNDEITFKHDTIYKKIVRTAEPERVSYNYATPEGTEGVSSNENDNLKAMATYLKNNKDRVAFVVKYGDGDAIVNKLIEYGVDKNQIIVHDTSKMADSSNADKNNTKVYIVKDFR
jgi:hypothetical protein